MGRVACRRFVVAAACFGTVLAAGCGGPPGGAATTVARPPTVVLSSGAGPAARFACRFDLAIDAFVGADATASAIGWEGNHQGVVTCLGGSFYVQDGVNRDYGFGIYDGAPTTWTDADGYLPAQRTVFHRAGTTITITEFADRVVLAGTAFVAVYCRVAVSNPTGAVVVADPGPSPGLTVLGPAPDAVAPGRTVDHDYVVAVDRFGSTAPWPSPAALAAAGGFDAHYRHMASFWNAQLAGLAEVRTPDAALDDAYRSGFVSMEIARSGDALDTGVNGYESEFSHDVVGELADLFTEGDFTDAHALLTEARRVVGAAGQYDDGAWTYAWPWAIYLLRTGDTAFVRANFATDGPLGPAEPSIARTAHDIALDRTGPSGIMEATGDIDADGYWTVDDYEALTGLACYRWLAARLGETAEARWAADQYASLLTAVNATLERTIARWHLDYLPCSMVEPNTANRCAHPADANWAAVFQFGKWAWDAGLFGAPLDGPGLTLIDATYDYGFGRLAGLLPPDTYGGYPPDLFSTGYDAGYGSWGLASTAHRDLGILGYEFMLATTESGPNSWWESDAAPAPSPWVGSHPGAGQGSSPHGWGLAEADKVLLDSLVALDADGRALVGRGVPPQWLGHPGSFAVSGYPGADGERFGVDVSWRGPVVRLRLTGTPPAGGVVLELPTFVGHLRGATAGTVDDAAGTVTLGSGVDAVTVDLDAAPG